MTPDVHTACPACPVQTRALYAATKALMANLVAVQQQLRDRYHEADLVRVGALFEAVENAQLALDAMAPFVDAHLANQIHALSVELVDARMPRLPLPLRISSIERV